jgi:cbb3-type cytochrome oxidase subunit 3
MKLAIYYLNKVGIAGDLQSFVSLFFFLLFAFIIYVIVRGNKKEYEEYGELPLHDGLVENNNSQNNTQ